MFFWASLKYKQKWLKACSIHILEDTLPQLYIFIGFKEHIETLNNMVEFKENEYFGLKANKLSVMTLIAKKNIHKKERRWTRLYSFR